VRAQKPSILTERDSEILAVLTAKVRIVSDEQMGRRWWADSVKPTEAARRSLKRNIDAGLLDTGQGMAHPMLALMSPVATWSPGSVQPDPERTSYLLQSRWTEAPRNVRWYSATRRAGALAGGFGGRGPRASELTHDLHLAELYLRLERQHPAQAASWAHEATLYTLGMGRNQRLPDAMVRDGKNWRVIEFGGAYPSEKVQAFHEFCAERELAYEIW